MQNSSTEVASPEPVPAPLTVGTASQRPSKALTKIILVQFRNGESVSSHPELQSFLNDGWKIRSAVPRLVESEGTKLLVVMAKPDAGVRLTRVK